MIIYFGRIGWGWRMYGIGYKTTWFLGFSAKAVTDTGCCGHASDCAVHNEPAMPAADCDCGFKG